MKHQHPTHGEWVEQAKYDAVTAALRAEIAALLAQRDGLRKALKEAQGCFEAADIEGWSIAILGDDMERRPLLRQGGWGMSDLDEVVTATCPRCKLRTMTMTASVSCIAVSAAFARTRP